MRGEDVRNGGRMKKLSVTGKVTIWYVIFLVIITAGFMGSIVYSGNARASEVAKTRLMEAVADASEEISAVGENFIIDEDLEFYSDGVYISVYSSDGELIEGRRPAELRELPDFKDKTVERLKDEDGETWYVYDSTFEVDGSTIWVRGIVKDFAEQSAFSFALRIAAFAFPGLIIIAAAGGYIITRRGFGPVRDMIETAENISRDGDFSRRIETEAYEEGKASKDEIQKLALTFNDMFDKIEAAFEKEKQFTSDVSHELRTPLSVIISQSEYAMEDSEYRQKALEVINREAKRMSGLVSKLLTIARSDTGRLMPELERINLSELCVTVAEQQSYAAEERNISVKTDIEPDIFISADESMMIRILLNLVDNSIKYGRDGGNILISLKTEGDNARMSVKDDGIGIEKKDMEKIWERFYRVDQSRSREGAGLGLAMVKALVKAHGGRIEAESSPGRGSRFDVYVPLAR